MTLVFANGYLKFQSLISKIRQRMYRNGYGYVICVNFIVKS